MKRLFKHIVIALAILAAFVTFIFFLSSGMAKTADAFLTEAASGNTDAAWAYLSEEFRASTTKPEFEDFIARVGLDRYNRSAWYSRHVSTDSGKLEGEVLTKTGRPIPVKMQFVKEPDGWKILHIERTNARNRAEEAAIPSKTKAAEMVKDTTRDFARAINNEDFTDFHAAAAVELQEQATAAQLLETFTPFIERSIDLNPLDQLEPMFTAEPALSAEGVLLLEGYYPSMPARAHFSYRYVRDSADWKLGGLSVDLKPVEQ